MLSIMQKAAPDRDSLVIVAENGTADIATVYDADDQAIYAASGGKEYAVPIGDLQAFVGPSGRIYVLKTDHDYVRDTERLAVLEKSIVLRQVTHYQKPADEVSSGLKIRDILLYALIGVLLLAVIFKK